MDYLCCCFCLKKNVVSHIQRIGCQPEKNYQSRSWLIFCVRLVLYTVANPARGLLNREKKKKKKSGSAPPRALLVVSV